MIVVLLDPRRPTLIPVEAIGLLTGDTDVSCTEELPAALLEALPVRPIQCDRPGEAAVLLSSNPGHPAVVARIGAGQRVIVAPGVAGDHLLDAVAIMDRLRTDGPWEREQNHKSLLRYLVEETYELIDAVHGDDRAHLRAELGDVLLQVLFHARIAAEDTAAGFTIDDVADTLVAKLRNRAPAVLAGQIISADEQLAQWNQRKAMEKTTWRRECSAGPGGSILDGIPTSLPALALAGKVLQRVTEAGLPSDLIPATLTAVTVTADTDAENALREVIFDFMTAVRHAEAAGQRDGLHAIEATRWRRYWPSVG